MSNNAQEIDQEVGAKFLRKVARLYLSSEFPENGRGTGRSSRRAHY